VATDWVRVRSELQRVIAEASGSGLTTEAISAVSKRAGVAYTTLARFLHTYPHAEQRTHRLQGATLRKVALALKLDVGNLVLQDSAEQFSLWPSWVNPEESETMDPIREARNALNQVQRFSRSTQFHICRAAVSAMLETAAANSIVLPVEVYRVLVRLDISRGVVTRAEAA